MRTLKLQQRLLLGLMPVADKRGLATKWGLGFVRRLKAGLNHSQPQFPIQGPSLAGTYAPLYRQDRPCEGIQRQFVAHLAFPDCENLPSERFQSVYRQRISGLVGRELCLPEG